MALNECMCWKTYTCLYCEDIAEGRRKPTGERVRALFLTTNRLVAECGTRSGYKRHRANGEEACAECKSAQNEAVKKYMRERASK
jgi:hypothetical protein